MKNFKKNIIEFSLTFLRRNVDAERFNQVVDKFSVVELGSTANTPFSDFEYVILLKKNILMSQYAQVSKKVREQKKEKKKKKKKKKKSSFWLYYLE